MYGIKSILNETKKLLLNMSEISDMHHVSYIGNLEVISRDFVILVIWRMNEIILKILRSAGSNFNK